MVARQRRGRGENPQLVGIMVGIEMDSHRRQDLFAPLSASIKNVLYRRSIEN